MTPRDPDLHDGDADFDTRLLPRLKALRFFRQAPEVELDATYAAYVSGDFARLCDVWRDQAEATRAALPGTIGRGYRAGIGPRMMSAHAFLASLRAVLDAGIRFRAGLSPELRASLERDFPWLEHRHQHVPSGWTPRFEFPTEFGLFVDVRPLAEARARWQLVTALNEVQQASYSADLARRFGVHELNRHAARERELAINYFSHQAPPATAALWRQCVLILDALNASVFSMMVSERPVAIIGRSLLGALTRGGEWRAFVAGLDQPQRLLAPPTR